MTLQVDANLGREQDRQTSPERDMPVMMGPYCTGAEDAMREHLKPSEQYVKMIEESRAADAVQAT